MFCNQFDNEEIAVKLRVTTYLQICTEIFDDASQRPRPRPVSYRLTYMSSKYSRPMWLPLVVNKCNMHETSLNINVRYFGPENGQLSTYT